MAQINERRIGDETFVVEHAEGSDDGGMRP
jgi:hypothetical protein